MIGNLLAWNFSYPALELFGGQLSTLSPSDLPFSLSPLFGSDVSGNPGFDFFAMPMPQAGSSKIVFTSNRDGNAEVYSMNADGSGLIRLTTNAHNDDHPRWSPNGTKILFQSDRDNSETGNTDVYVMNANGTGQTRLTYDASHDSAAVWSPDGSKIVFQSFRNGQYYQVYVMNADGTNQVNTSGGFAADSQPSWSPDGSKIAFASERDHAGRTEVYVMNANGTNQTRLTVSSDSFRNEQPAWSRDATKIAFVSTRDSVIETWQETDDDGVVLNRSRVNTNKEVYKMNADGSNQMRLTNTLENDDSPSWSPDGAQIIFRSERERDAYDPTQQLSTMNADGTNQAIISSNEFGDYSPSWNTSATNQSPISIPGGPYSGVVGQNVPFNGSQSFDSDGSIVSYSWNFGYGGAGSGAVLTHTYASSGTYAVMLTVTDNQGAQATASTTVNITAAGSDQYVANFNLSALARPPSPEESAYWDDILRAAYINGQSSMLLVVRELGKTLFESADYLGRLDRQGTEHNGDYVTDLYRTYLMREPDAPGLAFWTSVCDSNGRDNVRRAFDESGEFAGIVATLTPSGLPSSTVSSFASAQVDPFNQPGTGLVARDAEWSVPLLSLPGRAGLDLGLSLSYSSMVWTRSGPYIYFDEDNGWPSPGFRLGFPTIQEKVFDAQAGDNVYVLIAGSRVSLRQVGTSDVYEAADSSYLQLIDNGGSLLVRSTDGTQLSYSEFNNEWHCTQIKDRNGNFITVNYDWRGQITTIVDTLARTITFDYDTNYNLQKIKQTWAGRPLPHEWVTFGWTNIPVNTSFSGVMVVGAPNRTTIPVLSQVGLDDGSRHTFEYSTAGQVSNIKRFAQPSDNTPRAYTAYDYDYPAADCPRLSATRVAAENWTGINGLPSEVVTQYGVEGIAHTVTVVGDPNTTLYKEFYGSGWQRGLTTQTEVWSAGVKQKWTSNNWTQDNTAVNYQTNPRVTESNVDDPSNHRRTTITYQTFTLPSGASCSLPGDTREYAGSASTALRHTHTGYRMDPVSDAAYLSRHILGLVKEQSLFEVSSSSETLMSKVSFQYDETGSIQGTDAPIAHDISYDGNFLVGRANLSSVKRHDVNHSGQFTVSRMYYNTAGAVVSTKDPLNHEATLSYADSFSDNNNSRNTLAYPTTVSDADGYSSTVTYNFDIGAVTRKQTPQPNTVANLPGPVQILAYDDAGRIERVTTTANGAYQRFVYGPNYVQTFATVNSVADDLATIQVFDGAGRLFASASDHPGSVGGRSASYSVYDAMGRRKVESNPTEINGDWTPVGDDAAGWLYTEQTYDWQGRPRITTNTDGTTKAASYSGCGCAGGAVVTMTDEAGRKQKVYSDILGRSAKTEVLNWDGTVYSATTNTYNQRGQVSFIKAYQGPATTDGSCPAGICQQSAMTYDGYGRLETQHRPEQQVDPNNSSSTDHTTWEYNADDTVKKVIDARGASQTFLYNARRLAKRITYAAPAGDPTMIEPGPTEFGYDDAGNRLWMTDASGRVDYAYDSLSRIESESRQFNGLSGTYTLGYEYALSGAVQKVTDQTAGTSVTSGFDDAGRISTISTVGYGSDAKQFATQIKYRAWGGLKSASYDNNTNLSVGYNGRGMVSEYSLAGPGATPTLVSSAYQYNADGQIKFAQDLRVSNSIRDRAYQYDQVGRLKEAYSATEARDYVNNTNVGTTDGPFRQSSTYDAWNNLLSGGGRFWSRNVVETASFNQFNRNPNWAYDAEGNVLSRNQYFGASLPSTHSYDAAGNMTKVMQTRPCKLEPQHLYQIHIYANTQTHDGDGRVTLYEQAHKVGLNGTPTAVKTYYLRSSVLGGRVISEYDGSDTIPTWTNTKVYAGGERLGQLSRQGASTPITSWRAADPVTGDEGNTYLDPNGVDVGLEDPFPPPGEEDETCVTYDPNYIDSHPRPFLNPFEGGANCIIDGIEQACNSVGSEAAVRCDGPCTGYAPGANGGRGGFVDFRAFADGHSDYLPQDARYLGGGIAVTPFSHGSGGDRPGPPPASYGYHLDTSNVYLLDINRASQLPQQPSSVVIGSVNDALSNPDCQTFMQAMLNGAATKDNPVLHGGDIRKIFESFLAQKNGGLSRERREGARYGTANGRIGVNADGNGIIHAYPQSSGQDFSDASTIVNELPHIAGVKGGWPRSEYDDYGLAQSLRGTKYHAQSTLRGNFEDDPRRAARWPNQRGPINPFEAFPDARSALRNRYDNRWSSYVHDLIKQNCPVK